MKKIKKNKKKLAKIIIMWYNYSLMEVYAVKALKLIIIVIFFLAILPVYGYSANVMLTAKFINNFFWRVKKDINPHAQGEIEITTKISKDDRLGIGFIPFISHSFDDDAVDEGDWYIYLTYKTEKLDVRGGYIYYEVLGKQETPQIRPEQGEIYSSILFSGEFAKTKCYTGITAYFDIDKKGAAYTETAFSFDLGKATGKLFFNLGSIVGFDFGQFVGDNPQFTVLQLKAALNLRIAEKVFLVPNYTYVIPLDTSKFVETDIWGVSLSFR